MVLATIALTKLQNSHRNRSFPYRKRLKKQSTMGDLTNIPLGFLVILGHKLSYGF